MKKFFIYLTVICSFISYGNFSYAVQAKAEDYQVSETDTNSQEVSVVYSSPNVKIIKQGNKYGVFDVQNQVYFIKPVLDGISKLSNDNDFEYQIQSGDMKGYMNIQTKSTFISYLDEISILNSDYLKVRKDNKFGIIDKNGKVIVPVDYDKVEILEQDGAEYFSCDKEFKNNIFDTTGKLVAQKDVNSPDKISSGVSILRDLNPLLLKYRLAMLAEQNKKQNVSKSTDPDIVELDTEIAELPVPGTNRDKSKSEEELISQNDENVSVQEEEQSEINIETEPLPSNVQKLSVKHEDYASNLIQTVSSNNTDNILMLNNRTYVITNNKGKFGLKTSHGRTVIPTQYIALKTETTDKGTHDIIAAIAANNTKLYDTDGFVLAKRFKNKVNVYTSMRKYEYIKDGDVYMIDFNGRKIGEIEVFDDGTYSYKRTGFNMSNMNKANELFITLIRAEK